MIEISLEENKDDDSDDDVTCNPDNVEKHCRDCLGPNVR